MLQIKSTTKRNRFVFLWAISITIGWTLITYPGLTLRDEVMVLHSWVMLLPISLNLFVFTLLMGAIIGSLQYLLCRQDVALLWQWVFISAFSYGIGTSGAFLLSSTLIGITHPETLSSGSLSFIFIPLDFTMLFGGGLTALIQAFAIRDIFLGNIKEMLLWILATALSWTIGFFVSGYAWAVNLPLLLQSSLAGLVIGLASALLLNIGLTQLKESE